MKLGTFFLALAILVLGSQVSIAQDQTGYLKPLKYFFDGHYGQVEVGGPFVGVEFHSSRPLPSRISFYYPIANSIDLSTDYWKRGESLPMALGLQVDGGPKRWVGRDPWSYVVSPHRVEFTRTEEGLKFSILYEFCMNEPAFVRTMTITNLSRSAHTIVLYSHLKSTLRTCQTYARVDSGWSSYDQKSGTTEIDYQSEAAQNASVFVEDAGQRPIHVLLDANELAVTDSGTSAWAAQSVSIPDGDHSRRWRQALIVSEYRADLGAKKAMKVVQIIGSCRKDEVSEKTVYLEKSWDDEVARYNKFIEKISGHESTFSTGDRSLDESALWSKAILSANIHYLDGQVVPMPCPAEYNFFFSHDVLMTDLAAVNFDLSRVKKDLFYIASHAQDGIIPHAYYWRDDGFKTEYCTPDNWNHLWFILATAAYLRHSLDTASGDSLYPLVSKSLEEVLTQVKSDHLMHAFRPDWWDIGHLEGARSYTTILTIRALREYLFISSLLNRDIDNLVQYETLADSMQSALTVRLWDQQTNYLMNYNGETEDKHYYMGSLLAVVFNLLDQEKSMELISTAARELVDSSLGVRTATPPDFNSAATISFYKFAGEEAGKPYFYINGGVWPHSSAWYALALNAMGKSDQAIEFVKRTMTLDGIVHSPNGQPAMYEYRYADPQSQQYGMIDKPSFMWAGGFFLKTLYNLYGLRENVWNLSLSGMLPMVTPRASYTLEFGKKMNVRITSGGKYLRNLGWGKSHLPTTVLPVGEQCPAAVYGSFGSVQFPSLVSIDAILSSVRWGKSGTLDCRISSFAGHRVRAVVVSSTSPKEVLVDGAQVTEIHPCKTPEGIDGYEIYFTASERDQQLQISFK
ncbi:MAG TPA: amylo-alpha-1,6-glucosidase [Bacteroidota bacterium]|nr:amylo-alpha-1,6-glucosidase [Bacteroidota bacterium]